MLQHLKLCPQRQQHIVPRALGKRGFSGSKLRRPQRRIHNLQGVRGELYSSLPCPAPHLKQATTSEYEVWAHLGRPSKNRSPSKHCRSRPSLRPKSRVQVGNAQCEVRGSAEHARIDCSQLAGRRWGQLRRHVLGLSQCANQGWVVPAPWTGRC